MTNRQTKAGVKQERRQKDKYKVTNWRDYNRSLVKRGDITIWFDEDLLRCWYYQGPNQKGAQYKYSQQCMMSLLQLKVVFGLKYRQLEGFASSLLGIMGIEIRVPSYSQISRRAKQVEVKMDVPKTKGSMFIVFDSTGLKVYGEGEWKEQSGYHSRSLAETAMFRFKTIFDPQQYSRRFETQKTEVAIRVACLNIMTGLGMPVCKKVA